MVIFHFHTDQYFARHLIVNDGPLNTAANKAPPNTVDIIKTPSIAFAKGVTPKAKAGNPATRLINSSYNTKVSPAIFNELTKKANHLAYSAFFMVYIPFDLRREKTFTGHTKRLEVNSFQQAETSGNQVGTLPHLIGRSHLRFA